MTLTRQQIIDAACDLYGYGQDDFDDMTGQEIIAYLDGEFESQGAEEGDILAQVREKIEEYTFAE